MYPSHPEGHPGPGTLPDVPYIPTNKVLLFSPEGRNLGYFDPTDPSVASLQRIGYIAY